MNNIIIKKYKLIVNPDNNNNLVTNIDNYYFNTKQKKLIGGALVLQDDTSQSPHTQSQPNSSQWPRNQQQPQPNSSQSLRNQAQSQLNSSQPQLNSSQWLRNQAQTQPQPQPQPQPQWLRKQTQPQPNSSQWLRNQTQFNSTRLPPSPTWSRKQQLPNSTNLSVELRDIIKKADENPHYIMRINGSLKYFYAISLIQDEDKQKQLRDELSRHYLEILNPLYIDTETRPNFDLQTKFFYNIDSDNPEHNVFRLYGKEGSNNKPYPVKQVQEIHNPSNTPRFVSKSLLYIHEMGNIPLNAKSIGETIKQHLLMHYTKNDNKNYPDVKTFQFIPHDDTNTNDNTNIQNLINSLYPIDTMYPNTDGQDVISSAAIEISRISQYEAFTDEYAESIADTQANKTRILSEKNKKNIKELELNIEKVEKLKELKELQLYLDIGSLNTCKELPNTTTINNRPGFPTPVNKRLLLEGILNSNNPQDKQFILGQESIVYQYLSNEHIIIYPWVPTNYSNEIGSNVWNILLNKALVSCMIQNHTSSSNIFPVKMFLNLNPNDLIFKSLPNINNLIYLGFFIIRYDIDDQKRNEFILKYILDNFKDEFINKTAQEKDILIAKYKQMFETYKKYKPPNSYQPYYVFFLFKFKSDKILKADPFSYILFNYRCNFIAFGDYLEQKRYPYDELIQIISSNYLETNPTQCYFCLKKDTSRVKGINNLCSNQEEEFYNKKLNNLGKHESSRCIEAWFSYGSQRILEENDIALYTSTETSDNLDTIQLLVSKSLTINDIYIKIAKLGILGITISQIPLMDNGKKLFNILLIKENNDEYVIVPGYFMWGNDTTNLTKRRQLIFLGYFADMKENFPEQYKKDRQNFFQDNNFRLRNKHKFGKLYGSD